MEVDKVMENTGSQSSQKGKTEPPDTSDCSLDFIPLYKEVKCEDDITKSKNGNVPEKNGQKRIKSESDDSASKKPRISPPQVSNLNINKDVSDETGNMSDDEYYLSISNLPDYWTYVQIKNYLDKECGHVDEMEMLPNKNSSQNCAIRLTFQSAKKCKEAFEKLENKVIEDKKLIIWMTEPDTTFPTGVSVPNSMLYYNAGASENTSTSPVPQDILTFPKSPWRPDEDFWGTDPEGLYGLRPEFLNSLNITPPVTALVHVTNFRCDKTELKEVMALAGNVLMCCVVNSAQKYANVMYSHPLEAVQAISMLDGQMFYGKPLKITMNKNPEGSFILPKGLATIGLGLGLYGKPIRNIAQQYQNYIENKSSSINPIVFSDIAKSEENSDEIKKKIVDFMKLGQHSNAMNRPAAKIINIDELNKNLNDPSNGNNPEFKSNQGGSRRSSIGSQSPNQNAAPKKKPENTFTPVPGAPVCSAAVIPLVRGLHTPQYNKNLVRPGLLQNQAAPNPRMPMPTPGLANYGSGPNFPNQPNPRQFGPRVPFMPVQQPPFGPQPIQPNQPIPFGPPFGSTGVSLPIPNPNFAGTFLGPNVSGPRPMNPGNSVTVHFFNLPPSTTFPLLCEKLSPCGQVMSVQLTSPGCAVATFGHPSQAERCFQMFNGLTVEGHRIEVKLA